ncbi:MAG: hypothetical protein ACOYXC_15630 [Candidatus Rifleibacteriota bacterium]
MHRTRPSALYLFPVVAAIAGFSANLAQVSLFRFFIGQFYGTEMHLGIFLAVWLAGISLGGFAGGKFVPGLKNLVFSLLGATTIAAIVIYRGFEFLPDPKGGFLPFFPVTAFIFAAVFPVSFTIGMLLPAILNKSAKSLGLYYSYEAIGSFIGGIFFSFLLGGTASPILCLAAIPIAMLSMLLLLSPCRIKAFIILLIAPAVSLHGPALVEKIEMRYWKVSNPSQTLLKTVETPYQKLQLCSYFEQKSLFSNGMFSVSWPFITSSEQTVHSFMTALTEFNRILVIGAPPTDILNEFLKYSQVRLSVIELDRQVIELYEYSDEQMSRIELIIDDPRRFLNSTDEKFDGIMIFPVSPVTLAGNRLFTIEAMRSMKRCLNQSGVLSLQVSGTENYLGSIKEQIILSTWQALGEVFSSRGAIPGSTITFFACQTAGVIPADTKIYMNRFKERRIQTATFLPISFFNLLQPFRVKELDQWLNRPIKARLNTDVHPESFAQQLELWNVYSGVSNEMLLWLQKISLDRLIAMILAVSAVFLPLLRLLPASASLKATIATGVAASGATGLLCEIILIMLYQNSHGAAYQMTAFFFGIYMLGLAGGAWFFGTQSGKMSSLKRLKVVKLLQIVFALSGLLVLESNWLHNATGIAAAIFAIAFLDGIEFPVADQIIRESGTTPAFSAGLLLFSDNAGALLAGLGSGLWLLPTIGMQGCFILLAAILSINMGSLIILNGHFKQSYHSE